MSEIFLAIFNKDIIKPSISIIVLQKKRMSDDMKIFCYIGSNNGEKSTTALIAKELIKMIVAKRKGQVEYSIYTGKDTKIHECSGCLQCFGTGSCPYDQSDDMGEIKKKMLEANILILGSPVYFHSVSGNMKTFFDRISYWTHLMKLTGKIGVAISTSGGNGLQYVDSYISKLYDFLGVYNVGSIMKETYTLEIMKMNGILANMQSEIEAVAETIIHEYYDFDSSKYQCTDFQDRLFEYYTEKYHSLLKYLDVSIEIQDWKNNGFFDVDNFKEIYVKKFLLQKEQ